MQLGRQRSEEPKQGLQGHDADLNTDCGSMHSVLSKPVEDFRVHTAIQLGQAQQGAAHRRVPHPVSFQITLHLQAQAKHCSKLDCAQAKAIIGLDYGTSKTL